jgi:hypothetical protein
VAADEIDSWLDAFVILGFAEIETLLARHAAFANWLAAHGTGAE